MIHTPKCMKETLENAEERKGWRLKWPGHCRACEGMGGFHNPGVYRYADGSGEPPSFDECSCVEEGRCPRCGMDWGLVLEDIDEPDSWNSQAIGQNNYRLADFMFEEAQPCPCCGWNWSRSEDDILPVDINSMGPCDCLRRIEEEVYDVE